MKKLILSTLTLVLIIISCKKNDNSSDNQDKILSDNTIVVTNDVVNNSLVAVDSSKLTFAVNGTGVDKVKVGSILVSDMTPLAPIGYLRKVTDVSTVGGNKVFSTEQASLTDALVNANTSFSRLLTDSDIIGEDSSGIDISAQQRMQSLSFTFNYAKVLFDGDGNNSTTNDQIKVYGEIKVEPTFDFELKIEGGSVKKFVAKINLKNTNKINAESKVVLANLSREIVLKTFQLKPFTIPIAGVPVPIAKQWIAIVLGIDGSVSAKITAGVENINTAVAGISYQNNAWNAINTQDNSFNFQPLTFEGTARIEPWLQARYEIRPYGIRDSRVYLGVRGSVIGEATISSSGGLIKSLKWAVKFSAKAQMQLFDRTVLNYEQVFFEKEFPIALPNTFTDTRDGQVYNTVLLNGQTWLAENLSYNSSGSIAYNNNNSNIPLWGRLYTYDQAVAALPNGWRLPTDDDWKQLEISQGMSTIQADTYGDRNNPTVAQKLLNGSSSGLDLQLSGYRAYLNYCCLNLRGYYWSSTPYASAQPSVYNRQISTTIIGRYGMLKDSAYVSVRLIKN
jgi:uncharacterized protein (TIGR02145 family)